MKTLIMQMFVTKTPSGHSGRGTNYRNYRSQTPRTILRVLLSLLLAYLQTTALHLDKLVCVLQCDVETATGVYSCLSVDMMFKRQVSSVKLSVAQCSSVKLSVAQINV